MRHRLAGVATTPGRCPQQRWRDEAEERADAGEQVVLLRATTSPGHLHAVLASVAIMTAVGGTTSHVALVSHKIGKPCGVDVEALAPRPDRPATVDGDAGIVLTGGVVLRRAAEVDPCGAASGPGAHRQPWPESSLPAGQRGVTSQPRRDGRCTDTLE